VYASISGYGQTGPAAGARGLRDDRAGRQRLRDGPWRATPATAARPAATATFVADLLGGLYAFSAIQTALVQRARTGVGQQVDVALMDSMLNLLIYELQEAQFRCRCAPDLRPGGRRRRRRADRADHGSATSTRCAR
jgi:CoA:oxalate CoA-transferase